MPSIKDAISGVVVLRRDRLHLSLCWFWFWGSEGPYKRGLRHRTTDPRREGGRGTIALTHGAAALESGGRGIAFLIPFCVPQQQHLRARERIFPFSSSWERWAQQRAIKFAGERGLEIANVDRPLPSLSTVGQSSPLLVSIPPAAHLIPFPLFQFLPSSSKKCSHFLFPFLLFSLFRCCAFLHSFWRRRSPLIHPVH